MEFGESAYYFTRQFDMAAVVLLAEHSI